LILVKKKKKDQNISKVTKGIDVRKQNRMLDFQSEHIILPVLHLFKTHHIISHW